MPDIHADRVLILDFGAQYTQLIARRVRELGVYSEIYACDAPMQQIKRFAPKAIILSGGPESVYDVKGPEAPHEVFRAGRAGARNLLRHANHGRAIGRPGRSPPVIGNSAPRRSGRRRPRRCSTGSRTIAIAQGRRVLDVWMSHGDRVVAVPPGFKVIAASDNAPLAAMADESRHFYGLQFHPEVTHTLAGRRNSAALRARDRRLRGDLGDRQHHRGQRGANSRPGRQRQGAAGTVGRRRFLGAGGPAASGDRRPAHLRVRRSRTCCAWAKAIR